jgi:hypothetical protein
MMDDVYQKAEQDQNDNRKRQNEMNNTILGLKSQLENHQHLVRQTDEQKKLEQIKANELSHQSILKLL